MGTTSVRFDSLAYLQAFRRQGRYPAIHDQLFRLIVAESRGCRFLDLCCSTGLLGQRVMSFAGAMAVVGVDADVDAIAAARQHGVTIPLVQMRIAPETYGELGAMLKEHRIS